MVRPLKFLGIASRSCGIVLFLCGITCFFIGVCVPASEKRVAEQTTGLDDFVPVYQFGEFHSIRVHAPRERVYRAIHDVSADEITFFQALTWIRRFGQREPEGILNAPQKIPLLDVATRTSFLLLAEEKDREIVLGTLAVAPAAWRLNKNKKPTPEDFKALQAPGFALAAMNFRIEDPGTGGLLVTTETRVFATDAPTKKKFAAYWRVIYPGSALIRVMWLRAIRWHAERMPG
ncbi:MAG TPA: hypothetical protein VOA64_20395 [Candidatus Dormibacteraeota bacterium]|nr:hypothetical protein [Candidatus Dormibacteraeota bacterium]